MRYNIKQIFVLIMFITFTTACAEMLDPKFDNMLSEEQIEGTSQNFLGPVLRAYSQIDNQFPVDMDKLTDNAVDNSFTGVWSICGNGGFRPDNNPLENIKQCYEVIRSLNAFIPKLIINEGATIPTPVRFYALITPQDSIDNIRVINRSKGEAYFLRAYWRNELLRNYAGRIQDGKTVLGYPIIGDSVLNSSDDLNIPRGSYDDCVAEIVNDCDSAIKYLPLQYKGTDRVTGQTFNDRASGIAAMALKARVLLYAASPAFNPTDDQTKWVVAARYAGEAIKAIGGTSVKLANYDDYYFKKLNNGVFQIPDIIFRANVLGNNSTLERNNYPLGMYGNASIGVSQNFVDAFPDQNGYPITESPIYNESDPYINRDPRLDMYVAYNGTKLGPKDYYTLNTYTGGADAYFPLKNTSRTNYYLKKLIRTDVVDFRPSSKVNTARARIILGLPELYLNYCEAAARAWGVKNDPEMFGFSAYDVLLKIQARYKGKPNFLNEVIGTDVEKFIKYVLNERRLELSFEGHYFYDLRRNIPNNNVLSLNVEVYGIEIDKISNSSFTYQKRYLETRDFQSLYMPIPYDEIANAKAIEQNYGWE